MASAGLSAETLTFDKGGLAAAGFKGFVQFDRLAHKTTSPAPGAAGVYVVTYECPQACAFRKISPAGWFKGEDPTVAREKLERNWLGGAPVVYVGKAGNLRTRLSQFAKFGAGKDIGHRGGRLIWHLPKLEELQVSWLITPREINPEAVERAMLKVFFQRYGKAPFANDPDRMGSLRRSALCAD